MQGDFRLVQGGQSRYVRAGHKKEWPWNMMHDTRTRHCLGKLLSISGVNQGKGARSRPRTMGAWVSNTSSNDTGAPPIQAYKCERSCLRVYYHAYILTSLSFRPFLFPAFSPSFVPFFIGKDTTVHGRDQGICLAKKASYKGFRNPIGILSLSLSPCWNFRIDEASVVQTFRFFSSFHPRIVAS